MRDDFDAIPDAGDRRNDYGMVLTQVYHDIGLAAVADALNLLTADFEADLNQSLERGEYYLAPADRALARVRVASTSSSGRSALPWA